jgi:hypothetical protein
LARDRAEFPVAFQLLLRPTLDDRTVNSSDQHPYVVEFTWTRAHNLFGWAALLGQEPGGANVSHYAAPARALSLERLLPSTASRGQPLPE